MRKQKKRQKRNTHEFKVWDYAYEIDKEGFVHLKGSEIPHRSWSFFVRWYVVGLIIALSTIAVWSMYVWMNPVISPIP